MQRISTPTCQIYSDDFSQRDRETSSEHRRTSERRHGSFLPPILRASALLPGPDGNETLSGLLQKNKTKKSLLSHGLCERTHRQTACHWNQGLQTKALVHKGSLNIFVVFSVALFFDYKIFCCFPRKMGLMNQHLLEINYLKTFVRAHLYFGDKTSSSAVGRKYWFLDSADPETLIFVCFLSFFKNWYVYNFANFECLCADVIPNLDGPSHYNCMSETLV